MDRQWGTDGFDTARILIDVKSEMMLKKLQESKI